MNLIPSIFRKATAVLALACILVLAVWLATGPL